MPEQVLPKRRLRISWLQRTRQLYILPTRYGALYACMLLAMLSGAINYTLSLGFALTFLLAGLGLVAMLHAWRNLAGITLEIAKAEPVFAGEDARFEITASEHGGRPRYALQAQFAQTAHRLIPISPRMLSPRSGWRCRRNGAAGCRRRVSPAPPNSRCCCSMSGPTPTSTLALAASSTRNRLQTACPCRQRKTRG